MALSTRIVTRHTTLFAALIAAALLGAIWIVAAVSPDESAPFDAYHSAVPVERAVLQIHEPPPAMAFPPNSVRPSDRLCGWTADRLFEHHRALTRSTRELHARAIVGLTDAYLQMRCPSRIHDGDWYITAEILGVGLVRDQLVAQPWLPELSLRFDPASADLVPAAAVTFEILAPHRMCRDAARANRILAARCLESLAPVNH